MKRIFKVIFPLLIISLIGTIYKNMVPVTITVASKTYLAPANSAFTDQAFYNCVVDAYNSKNNKNVAYTTSLTDTQLKTIINLNCYSKNVSNVKGVEKLLSLQNLAVSNNQISSMDLSKNTALIGLYVSGNKLTSLNLTSNTNLIELYINGNQISSINLSKNTKLKKLGLGGGCYLDWGLSQSTDCGSNPLTSIDLSNNTELEQIRAEDVGFTNLSFTKNTKLKHLRVNGNNLTSLNVSNNTNLEYLSAYGNKLTSLDVSKNTKLTELYLSWNTSYNLLTSLNLKNNTLLKKLRVEGNKLTSLDLSKNTELVELLVSSNQLTSLDLSNNTKLTKLEFRNNPFASVRTIYKGTKFNVLDFNSIVKLPNGTGVTISSSSSLPTSFQEDSTGVYYGTVGGQYKPRFNYKHDVQSYGNAFYIDHTIYVVEATSDKYKMDDVNNYVYTGTNIDSNSILNGININYGTKEISNNKLNIKSNNNILKTFDIVNIRSDVYDLSKDYIYLVNASLNINDIVVTNGQANISNNKLNISKGSTTLDTRKIIGINFSNLVKENNYLTSESKIDYNNFRNELNVNGVTYKIFNNNDEISSDNIATGMNLEIYNNSTVIDKYTLVVNGDITGDGEIKMSDVMKAATQMIEENTIVEDCYLKAADVTGDGKIRMSDVMKLANLVLEGGNN